MSDTYMRITCRTTDMARFEAVGFYCETDYGNGTSDVADEERDCADTDNLPRDIPYYGHHDGAVEYGCGIFACDGARFVETGRLDTSIEKPAVLVNQDLSIDPDSLRDAAEYWEVWAKAKAAMESGQ